MARHSGKNGIAKLGGTAVLALTGWDFEESVGDVDLSGAGDGWADHDTTIKSWTGNINVNADYAAGSGQDIRAGDEIGVEFYSEGDASGKTYWSGTCTVTSNGVDSPFDGAVTRKFSVKGKGALTSATVV